MNKTDYPSLFQVCDSACLKAQSACTHAVRLKLVFIILTAFTASIALSGIAGRISAIFTAIFLLLSVISSLIIKTKRWERTWFNTRAIAESVKALTWRYMMGVPPFPKDKSAKGVETNFIQRLKGIKAPLPEAVGYMTNFQVEGGVDITDEMRRIRRLSVDKRKQVYLESRVRDQLAWYNSKSSYNSSRERFWLWATLGIQALAISIAIAIAVRPEWPYNPVGPLATVAASFVAWNQIKRHKELSQSYAMTARELAELEAIAPRVTDEGSLASFVTDTEYMISREHTMWHIKGIKSEGLENG